MSATLSKFIREELVHVEGVRKIAPARRGSILFAADNPSDTVLFVESGYVKLCRRGTDGKEVLIGIVPPGQVFGEEALFVPGVREFSAEVMQEGVIHEIPRDLFLGFCDSRPEAWRHVTEMVVRRERELQQKIASLCLYDVEARILHYLANLSTVFGVQAPGTGEYSLPLSQSELASLIGATRETTSTTLNALSRRGLVRLGRRLLVVHSADALNAAASRRVPKVQSAASD